MAWCAQYCCVQRDLSLPVTALAVLVLPALFYLKKAWVVKWKVEEIRPVLPNSAWLGFVLTGSLYMLQKERGRGKEGSTRSRDPKILQALANSPPKRHTREFTVYIYG